MFKFSMAVTLFMAGMELDFSRIRGRPLTLALGGWAVSLLIGFTVVALLHVVPRVHTPMMVTLALCTTGLGVLLPIFRDGGQLDTAFGRMVMAAGTVGEVAPIIAMSLVLSQRFSTWQEVGLPAHFPGHRRGGFARWAWACGRPGFWPSSRARCTPARSCRCASRCCCWSA